MRFAFSNIAWTPHDSPAVLDVLRHYGITGIEVAPTKVWPGWEGATAQAARDYRAWLLGEGFEIPAMQAVLFAKPAARLFDAEGEAVLVEHLTGVAKLAEACGAHAVVFGAPKQRDRGILTLDVAFDRAVPVFRRLGEIYADHGSCLCIEPNPRRYGCNFIINASEGAELVRRVDHPGFGLHLDAAGMFLEGDKLEQLWPSIAPLVRHYHISEPDLSDFSIPQVPHHTHLLTLKKAGYQGWCSVEMREPQGSLALAGPWNFISDSTYVNQR